MTTTEGNNVHRDESQGPLRPSSPIVGLRGVGPKRVRQLAEAGVSTVAGLLTHFPRDYEDLRQEVSISQLAGSREETKVTVLGRLRGVKTVRTRRRNLTLVQATVEDSTGTMKVTWFNRPYLKRQVIEGARYRLHGKHRPGRSGGELLNPSVEKEEAGLAPTLRPVYPRLGDLGPAACQSLIRQALERSDIRDLADPIPEFLRRRHQLPTLASALETLHSPPDDFDLDAFRRRATGAQRRLIYQELLALQLRLRDRDQERKKISKKHRVRIDDSMRQTAREILPFPLTGAQKRVLREIADDLRETRPMQRLLQGDVGCGKTIIAALSICLALENGFQAAFMAPTEILAEQHMASLTELLEDRYRIALVTGASRSDKGLRSALATGYVQLAIGTHALIQEALEFDRLALAIIDEQHRFGVDQRQGFDTKGQGVDLLVMTATPIPRSLALTAYGDLDLSVIDELPPGRRPIETRVLPNNRLDDAYRELGDRLKRGERGYVVFPLIDESDNIQASSLDRRGEELRDRFAEFGVGLVHGRMTLEERMQTMQDFKDGGIQLLLSTTVIEVGVDVPEASVMVIEGAERFGLAQLHQLRGRVGRGVQPSICFALHGRLTENGTRRLEVFAESNDGFRIAEEDLDIRGPGELLGRRQAGSGGFGFANPIRDWGWLEHARSDAEELSQSLPRADFDRLTQALTRGFAE